MRWTKNMRNDLTKNWLNAAASGLQEKRVMADDGHLRDPSGAGKAGVKPGERLGGRGRVTLQIIADRLDVSTATVSLALRDSTLVADGTRLRVQQIAREMGYSYNRSAASLR